MQELKEVREAKTLMLEAVNWSVMRWLAEKKRVRKAADLANNTLDELNKKIKTQWSDELKAAYAELCADGKKPTNGKVSADAKLFAKRVKQADDETYRAHMDAEDTFDMAERRLSTSMAREGTRKAILSWELHEKAIEISEAGISKSKGAS